MAQSRYLCSHLVTLTWKGGSCVVNLEEIWEGGAVVECEEALTEGVLVEIRPGGMFFAGRLAAVRQHGFGWSLEIHFSPLTPWSPERFHPSHLFDLSELKERANARENEPTESP